MWINATRARGRGASNLRATAAALAAAGLLAACGSTSSSTTASGSGTAATSSASTASAAASTHQGPPGAPIKIGSIGSCSGVLASTIGGVCQTMTAWGEWVNAHGGINGHPVKVYALDDAASPTSGVTDVKQLLADRVVAIVGEYSVGDGLWVPIATKAGLPIVGALNGGAPAVANPLYFSTGSQTGTDVYVDVKLAQQQGKTKVGIMYCAESPLCAVTGNLVKTVAGKYVPGTQGVYKAALSATAPSYTSNCLAARSAGVQALLMPLASTVMARVAADCTQQGYKPLLMGLGGNLDPSLAHNPLMQGAIESSAALTAGATQNPGIQQMAAALARYAPSLTPSSSMYNGNVTQAWAAAQIFKQAATDADLGPSSTSQDLERGLYMVNNATADGMAPPLTYQEGRVQPVPCAFVDEIQNQKVVPGNNSQTICVPAQEYPSLLKLSAAGG
jgi:branched-chain amino acid transport system substrate-binding protein